MRAPLSSAARSSRRPMAMMRSAGIVAAAQAGGRWLGPAQGVSMSPRLATLHRAVMFAPEQLVADDLAVGRLVQVLPGWVGAAGRCKR